MLIFNTINYFDKYTIYFSYPKSWVMWAIIDLHDYLMFFIINIFLVVLIFMVLILFIQQKFFTQKLYIDYYVRLNVANYNDEPWLEFFWTISPALLLTVMSWPSFTLLYAMEQLIDPFHTVIIVGNQWYWTYQYSDFDAISDMIIQLDSYKGIRYFHKIIEKQSGSSITYDIVKFLVRIKFFEVPTNFFTPFNLVEISHLAVNNRTFSTFSNDFMRSLELSHQFSYFDLIQFIGKHARNYESTVLIYDAIIVTDDNLPTGYPRLLCTDQVLILPANVSMRLLITSSDVIHSWALPSHGIKMDAIPGRINQVPFLTPFWGTYWGQCSELCGINHGFMPIEVRVVCLEDYLTFLKLNISYKYDRFCPLLRNLIVSYIKFLDDNIFNWSTFNNIFDYYSYYTELYKRPEDLHLFVEKFLEYFPQLKTNNYVDTKNFSDSDLFVSKYADKYFPEMESHLLAPKFLPLTKKFNAIDFQNLEFDFKDLTFDLEDFENFFSNFSNISELSSEYLFNE